MAASGASARTRRPSATSATKKVLHPALDSVRVTGSRPQPYALALTTAAHSTGTVMLASVFQWASMAARSMLRRPPASVGSEGAGGTSAGRRSGSWTVIIQGYGEARRGRLVQTSEAISALGNRGERSGRNQTDAGASSRF